MKELVAAGRCARQAFFEHHDRPIAVAWFCRAPGAEAAVSAPVADIIGTVMHAKIAADDRGEIACFESGKEPADECKFLSGLCGCIRGPVAA